MATAKPTYAHVREGTYRPGRHEDRVVIAHLPLVAPDWDDLLPGASPEATRVRRDAAALWVRLAPALESSINLSDAHREILQLFVIDQARLAECDREISRTSMSSVGQKGEPTRNHLFLVRSHLVNSLKTARVELGLSPKAASALVSPVLEDGDPDGVFD